MPQKGEQVSNVHGIIYRWSELKGLHLRKTIGDLSMKKEINSIQKSKKQKWPSIEENTSFKK
jgi:hypothetical protein